MWQGKIVHEGVTGPIKHEENHACEDVTGPIEAARKGRVWKMDLGVGTIAT
ncbi:hypothetical protein [Oryza sativa Japonica Group]|uniref:Uncharacterized protein n=1 Tax=Oryza sativa subsp. japonica TaxID=39947 RepID=Q5ZB93_ORYSJ|nr:hypothetical protein [Oryza sativa Japonica Group]